MYQADFCNQFKKDYKRCLKRGLPEKEIQKVMRLIIEGKPLLPKHKLHQLVGNFQDCMECHIKPDWLLVFIQDEKLKRVEFVRTGSHSDLFR